MRKFKIKTIHDNTELVVDALTFDELIENGLKNGANVENGMPWSWKYKGFPISHENDMCYLITAMAIKMTPTDLLISDDNGYINVQPRELFEKCNKKIG